MTDYFPQTVKEVQAVQRLIESLPDDTPKSEVKRQCEEEVRRLREGPDGITAVELGDLRKKAIEAVDTLFSLFFEFRENVTLAHQKNPEVLDTKRMTVLESLNTIGDYHNGRARHQRQYESE
jgi:hypothetical protein